MSHIEPEDITNMAVSEGGGIMWEGRGQLADAEIVIAAHQFEVGLNQLAMVAEGSDEVVVEPVITLQFIGSCGDLEDDHDHIVRIYLPISAAPDFALLLDKANAKLDELIEEQ